MSYHEGQNGPIILVLEDADKCLVERSENNINSIQALLNLGDGILGSLLDIRIVATTNAEELKMDEAITRDGRLSRLIKADLLDRETACNIFKRLCPNKATPIELIGGDHFKMTLAQVYKLARKNGWKPDPRKAKTTKASNQEIKGWN
jgi:SpoVK/Ycf46/Vps4 family AAA+-type ATPase